MEQIHIIGDRGLSGTWTRRRCWERGLGLVSAFSIAHQHSGDILVHRAGATGPGFELLLPTSPAAVVHPEVQEGLLQMVLR